VGVRLLGLPDERAGADEEVPWWEDYNRGARSRLMAKESQAEFWSDETKRFVQSVGTPAEVLAAAARKPTAVELDDVKPTKGKFMSMLAIAKFLHVNGSLYGGRDERRRLTLPKRTKNLRYQMTTQEPSEHCGTLRSLPRDFSGLWTRHGDGILS
jgi:hypothetical protein